MEEDGLRITLAVAGFSMDDLDIELEHNRLTIRGKQHEEPGRVFLHRGIAARQFQKSFLLADGIEVKGAVMDNGLLHIDMQRVVPETAARKIDIVNADNTKNGRMTKKARAIDVETKKVNGHDK